MTRLTYDTTDRAGNPIQKERTESDPAVIATLVRKGWVDQGAPVPPQPTAEEIEQDRQAAINGAADDLVDAVSGTDLRSMIHLVMRAVKRVRKEGRGQAAQAEIDELNQLETIADYVEAVRAEEARLLADTNLTVSDASWPQTP